MDDGGSLQHSRLHGKTDFRGTLARIRLEKFVLEVGGNNSGYFFQWGTHHLVIMIFNMSSLMSRPISLSQKWSFVKSQVSTTVSSIRGRSCLQHRQNVNDGQSRSCGGSKLLTRETMKWKFIGRDGHLPMTSGFPERVSLMCLITSTRLMLSVIFRISCTYR